MNYLTLTSFFSVALVVLRSTAHAATIRNIGAEEQTVQVTENGERKEVAIPAGGEVTACPQGCFMTFPLGAAADILPLQGSEIIVSEAGKARIITP